MTELRVSALIVMQLRRYANVGRTLQADATITRTLVVR